MVNIEKVFPVVLYSNVQFFILLGFHWDDKPILFRKIIWCRNTKFLTVCKMINELRTDLTVTIS